MNHVDAGHHLEQLAGHMGAGAGAGRRHVDLARIGLGVGDELRDRLGRNRWIDHHDIGMLPMLATGAMSRMKLKLRFGVKRRIDRVRRHDSMRSV